MLSLLLSIKLFLRKLSNPIFIIEIKNSKVRHVKGSKHLKFMNDCEDIVRENGVTKGFIYAVKNGAGKSRIKTSSEIPNAVAQRFRNLWSFYS